MSKVSDAIKEMKQFAVALREARLRGGLEDVQEGTQIAASYIEVIVDQVAIARNPFAVLLSVIANGRYDPFADIRPKAQDFIDKWYIPRKS